jgi:hypothetical protein
MESSRRSRASAAIGFDNSISSICVHISLSSALFSKLGDLTPLYFFWTCEARENVHHGSINCSVGKVLLSPSRYKYSHSPLTWASGASRQRSKTQAAFEP